MNRLKIVLSWLEEEEEEEERQEYMKDFYNTFKTFMMCCINLDFM